MKVLWNPPGTSGTRMRATILIFRVGQARHVGHDRAESASGVPWLNWKICT